MGETTPSSGSRNTDDTFVSLPLFTTGSTEVDESRTSANLAALSRALTSYSNALVMGFIDATRMLSRLHSTGGDDAVVSVARALFVLRVCRAL
jgi:hypothetical protein